MRCYVRIRHTYRQYTGKIRIAYVTDSVFRYPCIRTAMDPEKSQNPDTHLGRIQKIRVLCVFDAPQFLF